nr:GIY-YIG nuclease family protein [Vibrio tubiashii]
MDTLLHELTAIDDTLVRDGLLTTKAEAIFAALDTAKDSGTFRGIQSFIESNRVTKTRFTREYNRCQVLNGSTIADLLDQQSFWLKAHVRFVKHYHPHLLPLLKNRLNSYRRQHLYLFEFDDAVKIGMTRYAASRRLKEVESMLGGGAKGKVLAFLPYAGRVERLLHDLFAGERLTIGSHREFYSLEAKDRLTALFAQISNDKKRIASLRYIDKYKNVSDYLMDNDSVRPVAKKYGLSINTIQKLRHCMAIAIGDFDL